MDNLDDFLSNGQGQEPAATNEAQPAQEPVQTEQATGEQEAATPAETPATDDHVERHTKGLQAAAAAERAKRQAAEAKAQAAEQRLQEFLQAQQQPQQQDTGAPDPNDPRFQDNPQEYWRLLARFEAREELKARDAQEQTQRQEREQREAQQAFKSRVDAVIAAGQTKFNDFDAVINDGLGPFLNPTMQQAIALGKNGADVAYWLGKNPAEAHRISQLPPMVMLLELGEVAAKASSPVSKPSIPQTLTGARNSQGQFARGYDGPTPLDAVFNR